MTSYFARSASFHGIANLPELLQTQGIKCREAGQPISGQAFSETGIKSPWQDEGVTSCVLDPSMPHIRAGAVVRTDGSLVGD
jgi:hypothetical protein